MLVLSRKQNESIVVSHPDGSLAEIHVVEIRGDKVRLGIAAPREWGVHRREICDAITKESEEKEEKPVD